MVPMAMWIRMRMVMGVAMAMGMAVRMAAVCMYMHGVHLTFFNGMLVLNWPGRHP